MVTQRCWPIIWRRVLARLAEVESFALHDMDIRPCDACEVCHETSPGTCIIRDDMQALYPRLQRAVRHVVASPIYWFSVNAQTKLFIVVVTPWRVRKAARWLASNLPSSSSMVIRMPLPQGPLTRCICFRICVVTSRPIWRLSSTPAHCRRELSGNSLIFWSKPVVSADSWLAVPRPCRGGTCRLCQEQSEYSG